MYNIRYHVASLVAIFLALSVGLLLGTIVAERGVLDQQRDTLISSLRLQFEELDAENTSLSEQNAHQSAFIDDTLPLLVAGSLQDQYVVIIGNSGRADGVSVVSDSVVRAGGTPVVVTVREPDFGLSDPLVSQIATPYVDVNVGDTTALVTAVAEQLAAEWSTPGSPRPLTTAFVDAGVLAVNDFPMTEAASSIVTLAAWDGVADDGALSVAEAASRLGLPGVGVEMSTQHTGVAQAAQERGLSAVEDVGMPEGDYSLAMVLSGRASGYFGTSETAGSRYPLVTPEANTEQP